MHQRTMIIGNLGEDPQLRQTQNGTDVCSFSVAVNEKYGDKETVTWFRATAWRQLATVCAQYLSKGRQVYIEGRLSAPRPYQDKKGEWRASLDLTIDTIKFLGGGRVGTTHGELTGPAENSREIQEAIANEEEIPF